MSEAQLQRLISATKAKKKDSRKISDPPEFDGVSGLSIELFLKKLDAWRATAAEDAEGLGTRLFSALAGEAFEAVERLTTPEERSKEYEFDDDDERVDDSEENGFDIIRKVLASEFRKEKIIRGYDKWHELKMYTRSAKPGTGISAAVRHVRGLLVDATEHGIEFNAMLSSFLMIDAAELSVSARAQILGAMQIREDAGEDITIAWTSAQIQAIENAHLVGAHGKPKQALASLRDDDDDDKPRRKKGKAAKDKAKKADKAAAKTVQKLVMKAMAGKGKGKGKGKGNKEPCSHCKKPGHHSSDCWRLHPEKAPPHIATKIKEERDSGAAVVASGGIKKVLLAKLETAIASGDDKATDNLILACTRISMVAMSAAAKQLVSKSRRLALVDEGAEHALCGDQWLLNYMTELVSLAPEGHDVPMMEEMPASHHTYEGIGSGDCRSEYTVKLPFWHGGISEWALITVDVMPDSNQYLLFSGQDKIDFGLLTHNKQAYWVTHGLDSMQEASTTSAEDSPLIFLDLLGSLGDGSRKKGSAIPTFPAVTKKSSDDDVPKVFELTRGELVRIHRAGHPPAQRMLEFLTNDLKDDFVDRKAKMLKELKAIVAECGQCRQYKEYVSPGYVMGMQLEFNDIVTLDLVNIETMEGFWALSLVDRGTLLRRYDLLASNKSYDVAVEYHTGWLRQWGTPRITKHDRGGEFIGQAMTEILEHLRSFGIATPAFSYESHGEAENCNRVLLKSLRGTSMSTRAEARIALATVENCVNNTILNRPSDHGGQFSASQRACGRNTTMLRNLWDSDENPTATFGSSAQVKKIIKVQEEAVEVFHRVTTSLKVRQILKQQPRKLSRPPLKPGDTCYYFRPKDERKNKQESWWRGPAVCVGETLRTVYIDHNGVTVTAKPSAVQGEPPPSGEVSSEPVGDSVEFEIPEMMLDERVERDDLQQVILDTATQVAIEFAEQKAKQKEQSDQPPRAAPQNLVKDLADHNPPGPRNFEGLDKQPTPEQLEELYKKWADEGPPMMSDVVEDKGMQLRSGRRVDKAISSANCTGKLLNHELLAQDVYQYSYLDVPLAQRRAAEKKDLLNWVKYDCIRRVILGDQIPPGGQKLTMAKVEKPKIINGKLDARVRYAPRGFMDKQRWATRTDSPTVGPDNAQVLEGTAAAEGRPSSVKDVEAAFYQGVETLRKGVCVEVPYEWIEAIAADKSGALAGVLTQDQLVRGLAGEKLFIEVAKDVPGLNAGPRGFWKKLEQVMTEKLDAKRSKIDPCVWYKCSENAVQGWTMAHVDDLRSHGDDPAAKVSEHLDVGTADNGDVQEFTGKTFVKQPQGVSMDQQKYVENKLEQVVIGPNRKNREAPVTDDERSAAHASKGKVQWILQTRPELQVRCLVISSALSSADRMYVQHLHDLNKLVRTVKETKHLKRLFRSIPKPWKLVVLPDASLGSKLTGEETKSVGCSVVMLMTDVEGNREIIGADHPCSVLLVKSSTIKRVCVAVFDSECLEAVRGVDLAIGVRDLILETQRGPVGRMANDGEALPIDIWTDSESVVSCVNGGRTPALEMRRRLDIAYLEQCLLLNEIRLIGHIPAEYNVADPGTKVLPPTAPTYRRLVAALYSGIYKGTPW